jgi:hypothetical protein
VRGIGRTDRGAGRVTLVRSAPPRFSRPVALARPYRRRWASRRPSGLPQVSIVSFVLLSAVALAGQALAEQPAPFGRDTKRSLKVLELRGSPYERGLLHGRELRSDIAQILALWEEDLRTSTKQDPNLAVRRFLAETNFLPAIRKWTPDLLEEVRGIADGSGQSFERVFAFQLVDELWVFNDAPEAHHCSSLGVARSDRHPACVAQNMDLEPFRDGFQVVLHIIGDGHTPEQYVFSSAGLIGLNGVNRHAIAVACNTLMELAASADGLPVAFVVRGLLAQTSGDAALELVRGVHHASGQNYVVGAGTVCTISRLRPGRSSSVNPGSTATSCFTRITRSPTMTSSLGTERCCRFSRLRIVPQAAARRGWRR